MYIFLLLPLFPIVYKKLAKKNNKTPINSPYIDALINYRYHSMASEIYKTQLKNYNIPP
jgi:hypothetical protein